MSVEVRGERWVVVEAGRHRLVLEHARTRVRWVLRLWSWGAWSMRAPELRALVGRGSWLDALSAAAAEVSP